MNRNYVAYFRVSTAKQGRSGLGLEAQQQAITQFLNGAVPIAEFVEVESGKNSDRPQLDAALAAARKAKAVLVIAKLDRLARNVAFIANLMESRVPFVCCDRPNAKPFELHIYAAMAEEEARAISQRTKEALAMARARGVRLGAPDPRTGSARGVKQIKDKADRYAANVLPIIEKIRTSGVTTLAGIAEELNTRNVKTARGGRWQATTVHRVLARG
ncbi:MAG TPA: recombinase family protein [Herpetosiphonaceae bacterium]|nr:recombinase family protein [Herpetosiphonaceae bacterium]